jgi:hypothetical protein
MDYGYVAYIDEAGDPGLNRVAPLTPGGSSEWMIVAAALIPAEAEKEVGQWVRDLMSAMNSNQMRDLHFQRLSHHRKVLACSYLADKHVRLFAVVSNKRNMQGYHNPRAATVPSDNWFYCWLTRILLERVTHDVYHASIRRWKEVRRVKLEFSERGGLRYSQMKAYFEWLKVKSAYGRQPLFVPFGDFEYSTLHPDLMHVHNHTERDGLKLPDIVASAFFKAVDVHQTRQCDPQYAALLAPKMAKAPGTELIAGYGVKLMPNWRTLDRFNVPHEQRAILRRFGYPRDQWWQKVVEPGPV